MKTLTVAGIQNLDKQIVICIVYFVTLCMNVLPADLVVSSIYSPHEIVIQHKLDIA